MDIHLKLEIINDEFFAENAEFADVSIHCDTVRFNGIAFCKVEFIKMLKIIESSGEIE